MHRSSLLSLLFQDYRGPMPQLIVVHLGGNNLGLRKGKALVIQVKEDLHSIGQCYPAVQTIWFAMILRHPWHGVINFCGIDRAQHRASKELQ